MKRRCAEKPGHTRTSLRRLVDVGGFSCLVFSERKNEYDGVEEYWVCVKEKGEDVSTELQEEINESREKAGLMDLGTITLT